MRYLLSLAAALALAGCASTYDLTVMPRDSGKLYSGVADDNGSGEGRISITIEGKTYTGSWVETQPSQSTAYVSGGVRGARPGAPAGRRTLPSPRQPPAQA